MIDAIKGLLLKEWQTFGLGEMPDDLSFAQFPEREIRDQKVAVVTILVKKVMQGKETPVAVVRTPHDSGSKEAQLTLETEYRNLVQVWGRVGKHKTAETVPRPLLLKNINGFMVLAITYLPGGEMARTILSGDAVETFLSNSRLAFDWLIEFQKRWEVRPGKFEGRFIDKHIRDVPRDSYLFALTSKAQELAGKACAIFPQHGDFHASNIFMVKNEISGVVDWEDFEREGIPGFDMMHFIKTYFEALFDYYGQAGKVEMIEALSADREIINNVNGMVENYFKTMGIAPEYIEVLVPLYLLRSASIAASPRKKALAALKRINVLIRLGPFTVSELLLDMSVGAYAGLYQKALAEKNQSLADFCLKKLKEIKELPPSKSYPYKL